MLLEDTKQIMKITTKEELKAGLRYVMEVIYTSLSTKNMEVK